MANGITSRNPIVRIGGYIKNLFNNSATGNVAEGGRMFNQYWYESEINKTRYKDRMSRVVRIDEYLRREHKILSKSDFEFKEHTYESAKIVLQTLKSVIKFHTSYICGLPTSITGDKDLVSLMNKVYKKGNYSKTDLEITRDLITYGDAFEYVYLDENENIKSKVIKNKDSFPIYDGNGNYTHFVEYWKDVDTRKDHYIVYYPDKVEIFENHKLIDTKSNLTGLPIWYGSMDKSKYDMFGDPVILDLIPLMDAIEELLSELDNAVTKLSLNPLGVVCGARIESAIPSNIAGTILNLEDGATFEWENAVMDKESIKLLLDYLIQQFYAVASIPSTLMGSSNISNVSENSTSMIFLQTDNVAREYIASLSEGFRARFEYIRKLLEIKEITMEDDKFDSLSVSFNVNRPVDNKSDMANMKLQYECGAMSRQTMIDKSPYTTDTGLELQRIQDEADEKSKAESEKAKTVEVLTETPTTDDVPTEDVPAPSDEKVTE